MKAAALWFVAPRQVDIRFEEIPPLGSGDLLVKTAVSAISPGTEMLVYRGQLPADISLDATIDVLAGAARYPLRYGYAAVGRVVETGAAVADDWLGRLVFAFQPHGTHFVTTPNQVVAVPAGLSVEAAAFLPTMETAVSFVMDGRPVIGEQVMVWGQGIVGLLTTRLLADFPLDRLITLDNYPLRRYWSEQLGATAVYDPQAVAGQERIPAELYRDAHMVGADLVYELTGNPAALDRAIALTGFNGRLLIGSWYGQKQAVLHLGGAFHRSHMQLISSQVSHLHPRWHGRWTKQRRLAQAWAMLAAHPPTPLISHRFAIAEAESAYRLLDEQPETTLQIIVTYE